MPIPKSKHVDAPRCAVCESLKGVPNRWWVIKESEAGLFIRPYEENEFVTNETCATCGFECAGKVLNEWMRDQLAKEKA